MITAGGVYEDLIVTSPDSDSAAIEVNTTAPVVIRHVRGSGPGDFATRDNVRRGRFYAAASPKNVVIEHCEMDRTSGIEVQSFSGDGSPAQTVRLRSCDAREIDGRYRNGGSELQDFVGVSSGNRAAAEIAYNRIVTTPGQGRAEDNITMYKNGGTEAPPYHVFRNYIEGTSRTRISTTRPRARPSMPTAPPTTSIFRNTGSGKKTWPPAARQLPQRRWHPQPQSEGSGPDNSSDTGGPCRSVRPRAPRRSGSTSEEEPKKGAVDTHSAESAALSGRCHWSWSGLVRAKRQLGWRRGNRGDWAGRRRGYSSLVVSSAEYGTSSASSRA